MASSFPTPAEEDSLRSEGFIVVQDETIGAKVKGMRQKRFPIRFADGLTFCKQCVLDDTVRVFLLLWNLADFIQRVRSVLEKSFDWCGLGIYRVFGSDPTHVYVFMTCPNVDLPSLNIQLWEAGSEIEYYAGSQSLELNTFDSSTGLLEVPFAHLSKTKPETVELEQGGMYARNIASNIVHKISDEWHRVIADTRLAFRIVKGLAIMFVFATREELLGWAKMVLPKNRGLEKMVAEMDTSKIGVNFAFQD